MLRIAKAKIEGQFKEYPPFPGQTKYSNIRVEIAYIIGVYLRMGSTISSTTTYPLLLEGPYHPLYE
ncbi:hypothetical protein SAMN05192559_102112 [Halobacillus karajensis]|uniref:Uncharacterized protein n=1 Tax=Halobacillus karajensis TaxID=195088 RepID=A0A024P750_9BACI|nr:hypothetical protein [Halobacillus karajensis]CDQ18145.1 hypothetical protein BN982_00395 [Halobacillus karajensis]CDQ24496.1 hypothetical protein BN983_02780 [Halobacillus karajensis]CDQ29256.1 hypothetical protein BN981_03627 [Halobacillus karajensis]SEH58416.1 hypothetical protein SAMN05192559_102112 [Halobacillus karajensis]